MSKTWDGRSAVSRSSRTRRMRPGRPTKTPCSTRRIATNTATWSSPRAMGFSTPCTMRRAPATPSARRVSSTRERPRLASIPKDHVSAALRAFPLFFSPRLGCWGGFGWCCFRSNNKRPHRPVVSGFAAGLPHWPSYARTCLIYGPRQGGALDITRGNWCNNNNKAGAYWCVEDPALPPPAQAASMC